MSAYYILEQINKLSKDYFKMLQDYAWSYSE